MSRNLMNLYALFLRRKRKPSQPTVHITNCDLTNRLSSEGLHDNGGIVIDPRGPSELGVSGSDWVLNKQDRLHLSVNRSNRSTSLESVSRRRRSEERAHLRSSSSNRARAVIDSSDNLRCQSSERLQLVVKLNNAASRGSTDLLNDKTDSYKGSGDGGGRREGERWHSEQWLAPALMGALAAASVTSLANSTYDEMTRLDQVEKEIWRRASCGDAYNDDTVCPTNLCFYYKHAVFYIENDTFPVIF